MVNVSEMILRGRNYNPTNQIIKRIQELRGQVSGLSEPGIPMRSSESLSDGVLGGPIGGGMGLTKLPSEGTRADKVSETLSKYANPDMGLEETRQSIGEIQSLLKGSLPSQQNKVWAGEDLLFPTKTAISRRERMFAPPEKDKFSSAEAREKALQLLAGLKQRASILEAQQNQVNEASRIQEELEGLYKEFQASLLTGGSGGVFKGQESENEVIIRPSEQVLVDLARLGVPAPQISRLQEMIEAPAERRRNESAELREQGRFKSDMLTAKLTQERTRIDIQKGYVEQKDWPMRRAQELTETGIPFDIALPYFMNEQAGALGLKTYNPKLAEDSLTMISILSRVNQQKEASFSDMKRMTEAYKNLEAAGADGDLLEQYESAISHTGELAIETSSWADTIRINNILPKGKRKSIPELKKFYAEKNAKRLGLVTEGQSGNSGKVGNQGLLKVLWDKYPGRIGEGFSEAGKAIGKDLGILGSNIRKAIGAFPDSSGFKNVYGFNPPTGWDQMSDEAKNRYIVERLGKGGVTRTLGDMSEGLLGESNSSAITTPGILQLLMMKREE